MSRLPPPLPRPVLPAEPPPMAGSSIGYYSTSALVRPGSLRPRLLTAVGVFSIIVASISLLVTLLGLFWLFAVSMATTVAAAPRTPPPPVAKPQTYTNGEELPMDGLPQNERRAVVLGLLQARRLPVPRQQQVDLLLKLHGRKIILISAPNITPQQVRANISESGSMISSDADQRQPDYFVLGTGRLEVYDDHAVFWPSDGSESLSASTLVASDQSHRPLAAEEITAVLQEVQRKSPRPLAEAQLESLKKCLSDPSQTLISPRPETNAFAATAQVNRVLITPVQAMIYFRNGSICLDDSGKVVWQVRNPQAMTPAGAVMPTAPAGPPRTTIRPSAMLLASTDLALSVLLAIFLMIAGILVLRQSFSGRKLHLIYAIVKIPVIVVAVFGWSWLTNDLIIGAASNMQQTPAPSTANSPFYIVFGVLGTLAAMYPLALLLILNLPSIREYYRARSVV